MESDLVLYCKLLVGDLMGVIVSAVLGGSSFCSASRFYSLLWASVLLALQLSVSSKNILL